MPRTSRLITITTASLTLGCSGLLADTPPPPARPRLFQQPDGSCATITPSACPPPEEGTCNPPPPTPIDCPPASITAISRQPDGTCIAQSTFDCPASLDCEPLRQPVDCPEALGDAPSIQRHHPYGCALVSADTYTVVPCPPSMEHPLEASYRIEASGDGCIAWFTGNSPCPEGASCNPPPPVEVPCPP